MLATLMAVSFYFQLIISGFIFLVPLDFLKIDSLQLEAVRYWLATAHPIVRLPVFFMGICAGVLCIRIQQGDLDAFQSKLILKGLIWLAMADSQELQETD